MIAVPGGRRMSTTNKKTNAFLSPSGTLQADMRSSFTGHFLVAAAMHARAATDIETRAGQNVSEDDRFAHRGYVSSAVMQSTAALECEIWEVMTYGPGHHRGSNGTDVQARELLAPLAEMIDGESVLDRYATVLHLLKKAELKKGEQPWQDAALVVRLRNELVHYKSKWASDHDKSSLLRSMEGKRLSPPPFFQGTGWGFFPHQCLSAACASWSIESVVTFVDTFYEKLGMPDRLAGYRSRLP